MNETLFGSYIFLYTDPGTGAMLLQLLAAAFIGAAFYFRQYFGKIKGLLSTSKNRKH